MNTEELTITIKVDDNDASSKLDALKEKIRDIESLTRSSSFQHLKDVSESLARFAQSASNLNNAAGNLKNISDAVKGISHNAKAMSGATKAIDSLGNAIGKISQNGVVASNFTMNFPSVASGVSDMSRMSDIAGTLAHDFNRAVSAGKALASIPFKMMFTPLKGVASNVMALGNSFTHLFSIIGRVAFMRAIRGAIRMVTQALKEGVGAVYDWASAVGDSFVGTMNSISTSLTYFRNSIGAAISPILDAIAPVLDTIVDKCVAVINVFNQLVATLTGASTWRKAEKVATSYGDAANNAAKNTGKANDAVKALKRTLLGFDEINRLDAPNSGSGSGGSNGGGAGSSGAGALTFSRQPISGAVENFADMLRKAWDKADFTEIGNTIGEKVGGALFSVPWETKIQPGVKRVATSFGTLLTGMFDYTGSGGKKMWDGIAYTAYNALNTAMLGYTTFFNTVNWNGIGQGVGAALKRALLNGINWDLVAQALSAFPNAVIDAVTGFCTQMSPADFHQAGLRIGNAVADAIINIKWKDFFNNAFGMADRLLQAINGALEGFGSKWGEIKTGIINGIKSVPADNWAKIGTDIGHLIFNVGNFVANIVDLLVKALEAGHWGRLIGGIWKGIDEKVQAVYGGWVGAATSLGKWIVSHLGTVSILLSIAISNILLTSGVTVVKNMIKNAINGKLGGATGGIVSNGWKSGMLALAATSTLLFEIGMLDTDLKNLNWDDFGKRLAGGLVGAFVGFITGGWTGAAFGFTIGAELTVNITKVLPGVIKATDKALFGWFDKLFGGKDADTDYTGEGLSNDYYSYHNNLNGGGNQTVTNRQNRTFGTSNGVTYGSDTVTKAQTFPVMPDTSNSAQWWKNVQAAWDKIVSVHKASRFHVTGVVNEAAEWWRQTKTFWDAKVRPGSTKASRFHVTGVVNESSEWWRQTKTFWSNKVESGQKASRFHVAGVVNDAKSWWNQTKTFWNNYTSGAKLIAHVAIGSLWSSFADAWNTMQRYFNKNPLTAYVNVKKNSSPPEGATYTAHGGIYKNGRWQDIIKYAAGGFPGDGQMFIAREAGPEMVGTLNGSTAVVNNDQIVNSIADGVFRAASAALGNGQREPVNDIVIRIDSETLYRVVKKGERKASGRYGTAVSIG